MFFGPTTISISQAYQGSNPVADAGPDLAADGGDLVTIDASESEDRDGTITGVAWVQTSGPPVTLNTTDPLRPTFTAPAVAADTIETLTFRMVPTDNDGKTPLTGFAYDADDDDTVSIAISGADETAPTITPPADVSVVATAGATSANVTFGAAGVTDNTDPSPTVTYTLGGVPVASGDSFPVGSNVVTITATDTAGNVATETFTITVEASGPATMTMSVDPAGAAGGVARSIRYTITMPPGVAAPDSIGFLHDTSFQAPGVSLDPATLPANPCGEGSSIAYFSTITPGYFQMSGGQLSAGESCSFTVGILVPASFTPGSYTQLTGPVSTVVGGQLLSSPAATAAWSVSAPEPATLAMEVLPNAAPAGDPRTLRYTLSLPAGTATPDSIEFDHFVDFQAAGVTVDRTQLPADPCGTGSSFIYFASDAQYGLRGAQLSPGRNCTFDVVIDVPGTLTPGDYGQLTGPPRTLIGATTLTSAAVSETFTVSAPAPVANADTNTLTEDEGVVTGNVVTGASSGDMADENASATQAVVTAQGSGGVVSIGAGLTLVTGTYGELRISGDGFYRYVPIDLDLQAMRDGDSRTDQFTYTIANADGVEASTTLTITITGVDQMISLEEDGSTFPIEGSSINGSIQILGTRGNDMTVTATFAGETVTFGLGAGKTALNTPEGILRFSNSLSFDPLSGFTLLSFTVDLTGLFYDHTAAIGAPIVKPLLISVADEEGDLTSVQERIIVLGALPSNLTRSNQDLIGASIPAGTFAGTLASNDADSDLTFSLSLFGQADAGSCPVAGIVNDNFRLVGDRLETAVPLTPGTYTICAAVQNAVGTYQQSFQIEAVASDTAAPVISVSDIDQPLDLGAATATVTFDPTVTDNSGEVITPTFSIGATPITIPHSFPLGTTTVTVRAEDAAGNVATDTFDVTTYPDQPMTLAGSITGGTLRDGNPVTYQATLTNPNGVEVTDVIGLVAFGSAADQPSIGALPAGMTFAYQGISGGCTGALTQLPAPNEGGVALQGLTVPAGASCTISAQISVDGTTPGGSYPVFGFTEFDNALGSIAADGTMTAVAVDATDATPPVITPPSDQSVDTDPGVEFASIDVTTLGSASDNSGVSPTITYRVGTTVLTGAFDFPIGTTTVTMDAIDGAGNAAIQVSFDVTVTDVEAPVISASAPAPVTAAAGATTASVSFAATASDNSGEVITPAFQIGSTPISSPHNFPIGTTTVTVEAIDSAANTALTSFAVTVNASGAAAPIATDNSYVVAGDAGTLTGNVMTDQLPDSDPDGAGIGGLTAALVAGPSGGPAGDGLGLNSDGSFTYTYPAGAPGTPEDTVTFTYQVTDPDALNSNIAAVTLTLLAVPTVPNMEPIAQDDALTLAAGAALDGNVLADNGSGADSDPDGGPNPLSVTLGQDVTNGVLSLGSDGLFRYTPDTDFAGTDGFTYILSDGIDTATASVTLTVQDGGAPDLIVPANIAAATDPGLATATVSFAATATDAVDGDLSGAIVFTPASGSAFPIGTTPVTAEVTDTAGNVARGSFEVTITDQEAPVITTPSDITVSLPTGQSSAALAFAAVVADNSGETISPVFRIGGAVVNSPYTFALGQTEVTVDAIDSAGNTAAQVSFRVRLQDVILPAIALASDTTSLKSGETANITFTLTEPSGDFNATDMVVTGGSLGSFAGSGTDYSAVFTPDPGSATSGSVSVGNGAFSDASGNFNADGSDPDNTLLFGIDTQTPTASVGSIVGAPNAATFAATITLSEPSIDFTADDLILTNATATLSGSGLSYVATLTPLADGLVSVAVAAGSFTDSAGNTNAAASNTETTTVDTVAPTVTISGLPGAVTAQSEFTATIIFSEPVSGFQSGDVELQNASLVSFDGSGTSYSARIRPTGAGDIGVQIRANAGFDAAGNGNAASTSVTVRNDTVQETEEAIATFLSTRATQLLSNQPNIVCHLQGSCSGGSATISGNRQKLSFDLNSRAGGPVWFQITGSRTTDGSSNSDYVFGVFGTHRQIGERTLIGGMLQFDHISQRDGISAIEGSGWLIGPYFATKHPDHPLYVDGRLLWGRTQNTIQPFGTYEDDFNTERWLAQINVAGDLDYGNVVLTPNLRGSFQKDSQQAYFDSLGNLIPQQGVELGQLSLGLDFRTTLESSGHPWEITGGISAIHSRSSGTGAATATVPSINGTRARIALGASTQLRNGAEIQFGTHYDGIGVDGFHANGFEFGVQWTF